MVVQFGLFRTLSETPNTGFVMTRLNLLVYFQLFSQRFERSSFPGNKELQALLDFLQGIMILTEEDLIRFLDVLSKKKNDVQTKRHQPDLAKSLDMNATACLGTFGSMCSLVAMRDVMQTHLDMNKCSEEKSPPLKEIEMDKISNQFAISTDTEVNSTLGKPTENAFSSVKKSKRLNKPTNSKRNKTAGIEMDQEPKRTIRNSKIGILTRNRGGDTNAIEVKDKKFENERLEKDANSKSETNLNLDRNELPEKSELYKGGQIERCKLGIKDRIEHQNANGKYKIEEQVVDQDLKPEKPEISAIDLSKQLDGKEIYEKKNNESLLSRTPKKGSNENLNVEQVSPVIHEIKTKEKYNEMKNQLIEVDNLHKEQKHLYGITPKTLSAKRKISYIDDKENPIIKKAKQSGEYSHRRDSHDFRGGSWGKCMLHHRVGKAM